MNLKLIFITKFTSFSALKFDITCSIILKETKIRPPANKELDLF